MESGISKNKASRWRLDIAMEVAAVYAALPQVVAVFAYGSVARGWCDQFSDIELGVVWARAPRRSQLTPLHRELNATVRQAAGFHQNLQCTTETYLAHGVTVDVAHWTEETLETIIEAVTKKHDPALPAQTTVAALQHGLVLHGGTAFAAWQRKVARYPVGLRLAMVQAQLQFPPVGRLEMLAIRNDIPLLYEYHCRALRKLMGVLMGLNRMYYPGHKWTREVCQQLPVAPPRLYARIQRVFHADPIGGAREMRRLVEETFALVQKHLPEIDVDTQRAAFETPIPTWDYAPE